MPIIHKVVFDCDFCKEEQMRPVYGPADMVVDEKLIQDATEYLRYAHWNEKHLNCAVCGEHIEIQEMDLAYNDGGIKIHKDYADYYAKVERGDKQVLLHVHPSCIGETTAA